MAQDAEQALLASSDAEAKAIAEIEGALADLAAAATDEKVPLLIRLTATGDGAAALLSRYCQALGTEAEDLLEAPAPRFEDVRAEYERLFASCSIPEAHAGVVAWHRKMILKGRVRYDEASGRTGVPWWFIAIVHGMEAGFNFNGHLHNGDPLSAKTVQVPRGRPPHWLPPSDWLSSAVDALELEGFTGAGDWTLARALYRLEAYNGWGYRRLGIHSPYLWSFSNHYSAGKYVRDGKFDPHAISKQCGSAVMLKALKNGGVIDI